MSFRLATLLTPLLLFFSPAPANPSSDARSLSFYHTHTGKELAVTYYANGGYLPRGMTELREFLADWRDGEQRDLDPKLMDILWRMQQASGHTGTWEVISAYRSPGTNAMLADRSNGVARKSQHLLGKAIDVRLRGFDTKELHEIALELELGGVGYYAKSDFIHVDTGRVRHW